MNKVVLVLSFLGLGVALGFSLAVIAPEPKTPHPIEWLDHPRSLGDFHLESETGGFDNQSLRGHWTIVLFGFLHCPDICPTSLSQLATIAAGLSDASLEDQVSLVFVSVDPERDSRDDVARYARHFDASIRGVTGNADQLGRFAGDLGIQFKVSPDEDDYVVAHSIMFSIIDPEGLFRGRFRPGFDVVDLIDSLTARIETVSSPG